LKIYVLHGSVATELKCGGIINNRFIGNWSQYVLKNVKNRTIIGEDIDKSKVARFLARPPCIFIATNGNKTLNIDVTIFTLHTQRKNKIVILNINLHKLHFINSNITITESAKFFLNINRLLQQLVVTAQYVDGLLIC